MSETSLIRIEGGLLPVGEPIYIRCHVDGCDYGELGDDQRGLIVHCEECFGGYVSLGVPEAIAQDAVVIDKDRWERVRVVAELVNNADPLERAAALEQDPIKRMMAGVRLGQARIAIGQARDELQPGDLDPVP